MRGPNDLGALSNEEKRSADKLQKEIETHFREASSGVDYIFDTSSIGASEFSERVKEAVIARANKAGWIASPLTDGCFTVKKP